MTTPTRSMNGVQTMKLYTIKPLEWRPLTNGAIALKSFANIRVRKHLDGSWYWSGCDLVGQPCASLADGQAQAEACWQARVAGVLEEQK